MSKKDKGKGTQKNDDYNLAPIRNTFQPLANFPPLPYKTVVTKPPTKPSQDNYFLKFTEHLFLTSYKIALTSLFIRDLVQWSFGDSYHLSDNHKKTDNLMNLFWQTPSLLTLLIQMISQIHPTFYIQNALSKIFWASSNGKIHYKKDNFLFHLNQPPTTILITKWSR